jgi:hypothetical protein
MRQMLLMNIFALITLPQMVSISLSGISTVKVPTLIKPREKNTRLGGGIGFHGWIQEWENSGPRHLSWGCVVMHIYDIKRLYDQLPEGAMVVIF